MERIGGGEGFGGVGADHVHPGVAQTGEVGGRSDDAGERFLGESEAVQFGAQRVAEGDLAEPVLHCGAP